LNSKTQLETLSDFRFRLTEFVRFSEAAARNAGLTPVQYLLLLHLCGYPDRDWATVRELATRLHASHQSTAALIERCVRKGLVRKRRNKDDARCVEVHPAASTRRLIEQVATMHRERILAMGATFRLHADTVNAHPRMRRRSS
jgi:DNA-binding MarR family transcriptional regulator